MTRYCFFVVIMKIYHRDKILKQEISIAWKMILCRKKFMLRKSNLVLIKTSYVAGKSISCQKKSWCWRKKYFMSTKKVDVGGKSISRQQKKLMLEEKVFHFNKKSWCWTKKVIHFDKNRMKLHKKIFFKKIITFFQNDALY